MEGGARKISQNPPVSQNLLGFGSLKILQYLIYPEELRVPSQIFRSLSATLFEGGALIPWNLDIMMYFFLFFFVYLKGYINSTERMYKVEIIVCPCMAFSVYEVVRVSCQ